MSSTPPAGGAPSSTPGAGSAGTAGAKERASVSAFADEWAKCVKKVITRVADRAEGNVDLVRKGKYDSDRWLEDVEWFWKGLAEGSRDLSDALKKLRTRE